jgi:hypothetical protein
MRQAGLAGRVARRCRPTQRHCSRRPPGSPGGSAGPTPTSRASSPAWAWTPLDIPDGLAPRALRDIEAGQAAGRFTVPDLQIALSAVAGGLLGLLRTCQRHPDRVTEATVDQLAEAELRLLGVPADEAARLTALPLPATGVW